MLHSYFLKLLPTYVPHESTNIYFVSCRISLKTRKLRRHHTEAGLPACVPVELLAME